jgi:hypothetical protein
MIYSTDMDTTWMIDAKYAMTSGYDADGLMTWQEANTWVQNLSYGGFSDWRLPTFDPAYNRDDVFSDPTTAAQLRAREKIISSCLSTCHFKKTFWSPNFVGGEI